MNGSTTTDGVAEERFASSAHSLGNDGFDRIVSGLYDAATGGRPWAEALVPIQDLFGARAVVLHTTDLVDGHLLSLELGGPRLERIAHDYVAGWERHDPRKQFVLEAGMAAAGNWLHSDDFHDDRFCSHNVFYRHFLAAAAIQHASILVIPLDGRTATCVAIELHASRAPLDADERDLARRLGVHLQGAMQGHGRMRALAAKSLVGHQLLQAFSYPMWLLGPDRGVQYANDAAALAERQERPLRRQQGRLRLADDGDERRLTALMHELLQLPHHTRRPLRLRGGTTDGDPAWLHLTVLDPQQVMGLAFGPQRCVLATLFRPSQVSALDPFALARMFDLTPAEARVAALLGEGLEPAAIAARLHVRLTTVRTHVRNVLAALNQRRMVDAVRLLRQGEALWAGAASGGNGG